MAEPMKPAVNRVGQIETPMMACNVGRNNTPTVKKYPGMPSGSGGTNIIGPGKAGSWKR